MIIKNVVIEKTFKSVSLKDFFTICDNYYEDTSLKINEKLKEIETKMSNTSRYEYKLNYEDGKIKALYQAKNDHSNKGYFIFDVYTYGDDLLLIEMNLYDFYYLDDFLPSEFRCAIVNENYNDILDIIEIFNDFENGVNIKKEYKPLRFPYFTKREKMNNFSILLNTEDNIINLSICLKGTEK